MSKPILAKDLIKSLKQYTKNLEQLTKGLEQLNIPYELYYCDLLKTYNVKVLFNDLLDMNEFIDDNGELSDTYYEELNEIIRELESRLCILDHEYYNELTLSEDKNDRKLAKVTIAVYELTDSYMDITPLPYLT